MATQFLLTSLGPIIGGMSLETFLLRSKFPSLYQQGETLPGVPKSFGLVVFVNVCCSTVVMMTLGFKVSAARRKYLDKVSVSLRRIFSFFPLISSSDVACGYFYLCHHIPGIERW